MSRAEAILLTLVVYSVLLISIGIWASRRTHDNADFFLGGRRLGALVAAISASASNSSAWTLLGLSGAAYVWGLSALWLLPATVPGYIINWYWVAPRMMRLSKADGSVTLTEFIAGRREDPLYGLIVRSASAIILFAFTFYVASQLQAAGLAFSSSFDLPMSTSVTIGAGVIILYTLLGGFWAVSVTDTVQGLLMAVAAVILPYAALIAVGGIDGLWQGLNAVGADARLGPEGDYPGIAGVAFVIGTLGILLGYPGQPHVVNRFMALRDEQAMRRARHIALAWALLINAGMILLGLCARVLYSGLGGGEGVFYEVANRLLPPVASGVMVAAVLSAIMSTADSQLLVGASSLSYDWSLDRRRRHGLTTSRLAVLALAAIATGLAILAPATIFSRVLFAWHMVGSAFAPLVLLRICGYTVSSRATLGCLLAGFGLTALLHELLNTPADVVEKFLPFIVALAIAIAGRERAHETTSLR